MKSAELNGVRLTSRRLRFLVVAMAAMFAVSAWGQSPAVSFTPPNPDLGVQLLATSSPAAQESVLHQAAAPIVINAIRLQGPDAGDFAVGGIPMLPVTLLPGASLSLQITFTPNAPWTPGSRHAHLIVDAGHGAYPLVLTGMGVTCAGHVWAASSNGACADTDGDGFNDAWEDNGYIDLNNNGIEDAGDFIFPVRRSHIFSDVQHSGAGQGQLFPTVADSLHQQR